MACDGAGNLFVAASLAPVPGGGIFKYTPSGTRTIFASGLYGPEGLAFNSEGNLFEADTGLEGDVYEFTPAGVQSTFASGLYSATELAFDSAGDLFVLDFYGSKIYKFTPNGVGSVFVSGLFEPAGLAINSDDDLFVTDGDGIIEITPNGTQSLFTSTPGIHLAFQPVPEPSGLALLAVGTATLVVCRRRHA